MLKLSKNGLGVKMKERSRKTHKMKNFVTSIGQKIDTIKEDTRFEQLQ